MANSKLQGKEYILPPHILKLLKQKGNEEGGDRVSTWLTQGKATYEQLKRLKHDIENVYKTDWSNINMWLNAVLDGDRDRVKRHKSVQQEIGIENKFRRTHEKDANSINAIKTGEINENKNMGKKVIKITETQLVEMIENTLKGNEKRTVLNNFRVVAVSDNTNSFGLYQFIAISKTGEVYKLHTSYLGKPKKGDDIVIEQYIDNNGKTSFKEVRGIGVELPEKMNNAPQKIIDTVFGGK